MNWTALPRRIYLVAALVLVLCTPASLADSRRVVVVGLPQQAAAPLGFWETDQPSGFSVDYLRALAEQAGLELKFRRFATFEQATAALCERQVDMVADLLTNALRQRCMIFSRAYLDAPLVMVVRRNTPAVATERLSQRQFVGEQGYVTSQWLAQRLTPGHLRLYPDTRAALLALQSGQGDAYLGEPYPLHALLRDPTLRDLQVRAQALYQNPALHLGIRADRPELRQALDLAMTRLPADVLHRLQERWLDQAPASTQAPAAVVDARQRRWLDHLPRLRVGYSPDMRPLSFRDEHDRPRGLSMSYLDYLMQGLGLVTAAQPVSDTSGDDEDLDLLIPVNSAAEHRPGWLYTLPFVRIPNVLVTRNEAPAQTALEEMNGKTLAMPTSPFFARQVHRRLPDSQIVQVSDAAEGLAQVRDGKVYGYLGNLVVVDQLLGKTFGTQLKIAATTDIPMNLSIAVAERHAQLVPLLDRMIQRVPAEQRELFAQQWLRNQYKIGISAQRLWWSLGSVAAAALTIILVLLGVQRSLKARQRALSEAQTQLTAQLRFIEELLDAYPYPLAVKDRQRRYRMFNKAYVNTFGLDPHSAIGRAIDELQHYPQAIRRRISRMTRTALARDRREQIELVMEDANGRSRTWLYLVTPFHQGADQAQGVLTTFIDVTSIRAAERLAEQTAEAKAAFLATMSHEIRTPMNGVMGLLELMGHYRLPPEPHAMLITAQESTRALQQVLDDTLDFSRLDSGKFRLVEEPVDLRRLIDSVLRLIAPQAQAKALELVCVVDRRLASRLRVDGNRLRQVLLNLLSNACKFTEQGQVILELRVLRQDAQNQRLRLSVIDTGVGMSSALQQRLFSPFVQDDSDRASRYGGSGLGLMISRQLIELMEGSLLLGSQPGEGTRIDICLRLAVVEPLAPAFPGIRVRLSVGVGPACPGLDEHLAALGIQTVVDDAQLAIVLEPDGADPDLPTLFITHTPLSAGYASEAGRLRVSSQPLAWSALHTAVEQLLREGMAPPELPAPARPCRVQGHVLVVDDHPTNRLVLMNQLQRLGLSYSLAENGHQALSILQQAPADLVLTDCYMPGMDGYALARSIRQLAAPHCDVPVMGMTASIHADEQVQARQAGMTQLLRKPFSLDRLRRTLESVLSMDSAPDGAAGDDLGQLRAAMQASFVEETLKDTTELEAALRRDDRQRVDDLLHRWIGCLRLLELDGLADQAKALCGEPGDSAAMSRFIDELHVALRSLG